MSLKDKEIIFEDWKETKGYFYKTKDVKQAVLEFENWLKQYYDEHEEYEVQAYSEVYFKFTEIFGDWK